MATKLDEAIWQVTGATKDGNDKSITEDTSTGRHMVFQDLQGKALGIGLTATYKATVRFLERDNLYLSARENNFTFAAAFRSDGTLPAKGSNVSSQTSIDNGDGTFEVAAKYIGSFSQSNTRFVIGAFEDDGGADLLTLGYTGDSAITPFEVTQAWVYQGSTDIAYKTTTDRSAVPDEVGSNDAAFPSTNPPTDYAPSYITHAGTNGLEVPDTAYDLDEFTIRWVGTWDGTTGAEKQIIGHWDAGSNDRAVQLYLDSTGHFVVELSSNGTAIPKKYEQDDPLDSGALTMLVAHWDGTSLRLWHNDVELSAGSTMTKTTDSALSGNINDSADVVKIGDGHYGRTHFAELLDGPLEQSDVDGWAAEWGVSGLPAGGGGGSDPWPDTLAELEDKLTNEEGVTKIYYVDNRAGQGGSDSNDGLSTSSAFLTWGKLTSVLLPGEAGIISGARGHDDRYQETVDLAASGTSGAKIYYCGNPEARPVLDGTETFDETWTNTSGEIWETAYTESREYSLAGGYGCTGGSCTHESVWMSHGIYFKDHLLHRMPASALPALERGESWFLPGSGDNYDTPQKVYIRLPDGSNPNSATVGHIRITRDIKSLFDHSTHTWESYPGGTGESQVTDGRDHIACWGVDFFGGPGIRKRGMVAIRGDGWDFQRNCIWGCTGPGLQIYGTNHFIYNNYLTENGQYGFKSEFVDGITFQRNRIVANNITHHPTEFAAGGCKIETSGRNNRCEWSENYFQGNFGVGQWFDIDNGKGSPSEDGNLVTRSVFAENIRTGLFIERTTRYTTISHSVSWNNDFNTAGSGGQTLGSGLRTSSSNFNTYDHFVSVYNHGKGWNYKDNDGRSPINNDTVSFVSFIQNCRESTIDQQRVQIQGGDDQNYTADWDTSVIDSVLTSFESLSGVSHYGLRTPSTTSDTVATFEGWNGATNTEKVTDPNDVVDDYTDKRGCFAFKEAYSNWQPVLTHPEDYDDYYTPDFNDA